MKQINKTIVYTFVFCFIIAFFIVALLVPKAPKEVDDEGIKIGITDGVPAVIGYTLKCISESEHIEITDVNIFTFQDC